MGIPQIYITCWKETSICISQVADPKHREGFRTRSNQRLITESPSLIVGPSKWRPWTAWKPKLLCFEWSPPWHKIEIFWHSIRHSYLAFYLTCLSDIISDILSSILSDIFSSRWGPARPTVLRISPSEVRRGPQHSDSRRLRSGEAHCDRELSVEVRRGPLRSRAGRWGPARPTAIKSWQRRSGEAHCDRELAVEIRRGPLQSRAGRWGPARPTAIESWQLRSGEPTPIESWQTRSGEEEEEEGRKRRRRAGWHKI